MSPEGWQRRRVRDFSERLKRVNMAGLDLEPLSITKDRGVILQSEKYNKRIATDPRKYVFAEDGDFAFDPMSLYYGAIGRVGGIGRGLVSPDYVVFKADPSVDPDFLHRLLRYPEMHKVYESLSETGNTFGKRRRLYWSIFEDIELELPPRREQTKIAEILASVDRAIEAARAVIEQLQVVKKAMMAELLTRGLPGRHTRFKQTDIGEIPEAWSVRRIGDLATVGNGSTPSKARLEYWESGTVPWLPTGKVNDRVIKVAESFVTDKALRECPIQLLPVGTLLIAMIGQGKTRGKVAYLATAATINQNFAFIRPCEVLHSWFLFLLLDHQYEALRGSGRGSNQGALNCGIIKQFPVPVPPLEEQQQIEKMMLSFETRLEAEEQALQGTLQMKAALMSVLLTGEVRVKSDPEPA